MHKGQKELMLEDASLYRKIAVMEQIREIEWEERDGYGLRWIAY